MTSRLRVLFFLCFFAAKTMIALKGKYRIPALAATSFLLMLSCGITELGGEDGFRSDGAAGQLPGEPPAESAAPCYVLGVDYPSGYDWVADREKGSVKCSLVVFVDGIPKMKIPSGDLYEVSTDPDMARIIDGHLYTDFSTDSETVIKKDGKELFRYAGREFMCGMSVVGDTLYTLGQSRDGTGFSFRRNGEVVVGRSAGYLFGRLQKTEGRHVFAFCEPILSADGSLERYYLVIDGKVSQIAVREDVEKVWDVVYHCGEVCIIAALTGIPAPVIMRGNGLAMLDVPASQVHSCRLLPAGTVLYADILMSVQGNQLKNGIWKGMFMHQTFDSGLTVSAVCADGETLSCVLNPSDVRGKGVIYRCGDLCDMPSGYVSMGSRTAGMSGGILHVGLSSSSCGKPALWRDGELHHLDFNGYISSVTFLQ